MPTGKKLYRQYQERRQETFSSKQLLALDDAMRTLAYYSGFLYERYPEIAEDMRNVKLNIQNAFFGKTFDSAILGDWLQNTKKGKRIR